MIDKYPWGIRRRIIIATLVWCALLVTYLAIWGRPTSWSEAIATNLLLLMGGVIGSYCSVRSGMMPAVAKRKLRSKPSTKVRPIPASR
jgi:hypothetical protein